MLQRVAQLLRFISFYEPFVLELPDEQVSITSELGSYRLQSTARPNPVIAPGQAELLIALAPVVRRAVDQKLAFRLDVKCSGLVAFSYVSSTAVLDPAFARYLNDLQPLGLSEEEAFLARFGLLVDRLAIVGPSWGVETEGWSVMCYKGSNPFWTKGNRRGIWERAVESARKEYQNGMTLKLYTAVPLGAGGGMMKSIVAQFQPPSYNLAGIHRSLL